MPTALLGEQSIHRETADNFYIGDLPDFYDIVINKTATPPVFFKNWWLPSTAVCVGRLLKVINKTSNQTGYERVILHQLEPLIRDYPFVGWENRRVYLGGGNTTPKRFWYLGCGGTVWLYSDGFFWHPVNAHQWSEAT